MVSNLLPFYSEKAEKLRIRFKIYFQFKLQAKASKWFCQSQQPVCVRMGLWHMRCLYQGWHPEKSWLCNRDKYWALKWQDCLRKPIGYRLANWVCCKPLSPWKDHCFILTGIDSFSMYGFVFPASSWHHYLRVCKVFISLAQDPTLHSIRGHIFQKRKNVSRSNTMGFISCILRQPPRSYKSKSGLEQLTESTFETLAQKWYFTAMGSPIQYTHWVKKPLYSMVFCMGRLQVS